MYTRTHVHTYTHTHTHTHTHTYTRTHTHTVHPYHTLVSITEKAKAASKDQSTDNFIWIVLKVISSRRADWYFFYAHNAVKPQVRTVTWCSRNQVGRNDKNRSLERNAFFFGGLVLFKHPFGRKMCLRWIPSYGCKIHTDIEYTTIRRFVLRIRNAVPCALREDSGTFL